MSDVDVEGARPVGTADAPGRLAAGTEFGGYTIRSLLGKGAMGAVYEAVDGGGTAVALKLLHPHLAGDPVARERLRREVTALQRLRHPAVARVLDAELEDAGAFVVTELVEGRTLEAEVDQGGPLDPVDLYELADQLAAALEVVHLAGLVHRDLKPSNVMVTAHGPVLIDFGIAVQADAASTQDPPAALTLPGFVIGTPGYLAPELLDGGAPTPESDWWSWSALLAFAATGRSPFGVRPTELVLRRSREGRADLVGLPAGTARALAGALQSDLAVRWGPSQVARALRRDADAAAFAAMNPETAELEGEGATQRIAVHPDGGTSRTARPDDPDPTRQTPLDDTPTQVVGTPVQTVVLPQGADPQAAAGAHDGLTRVVPVTGDPALAPAAVPVGEVRYQAYGDLDQDGAGLADPADAPSAGPYAPAVMPRRTGTVLAFAAPLVVFGATRPALAFGALAILVVLCRVAGHTVQAFRDRRTRFGGPRGSDGVVAALKLPWHLVAGVIGAIPQLLVSACVGVLVVVGGFWLFGAGRVIVAPVETVEARSVGGMNETIVFVAVLAVAMALAVVVAWFGPAGTTGRAGARALLHTFAPGWIGAAVVVAACLVGAWLLAGPILDVPLLIDWWPFGGPPPI